MLINRFNFNFLLKVIVYKCFFIFYLPAFAQFGGGSYEQFWAAIQRDQVRPIQSLQARGFDLNSPNPDLTPPLVHALFLDHRRVAEYLAEAPETNIHATNTAGESPLMMAALRGHVSLVELLIRRGATVNQTGWAPLHYAASNPSDEAVQIVRILLREHAYVDAESPNGSTPLMLAAQYGHENVVQLLMQEGAQVLQKNQQGLNALDFARRVGREHLIPHMLKYLPKPSNLQPDALGW